MRFLWRTAKRLLGALLIAVVGLLAPVAYVELACRGEAQAADHAALLPPEHHRPEARTLLTYPEWHIVHAYDDYAQVIAAGDPHDYGYLRAITGFWSSLCALSQQAGAHGGVDAGTKQMVYVIGVSFSAELLLKAAYEETLGRVATLVRGEGRTATDDLSAQQAASYTAFLQQVPWYKWDFAGERAALGALEADSFRDTERRVALGLEYGAKSAYAGVIAKAVEGVGADALTLRLVARDVPELEGVTRVETSPEGEVLETPRYRELTHMLVAMAEGGAQFIEIAGNDDIMFTALSDRAEEPGALHSFPRQGYGDHRHLILVKVADLAETLRGLDARGLALEHIHDY